MASGDVTLLTDGKSRNTRRRLVERGRPRGLFLHPPQREGHRPLRHEPRRPQDRPAARRRSRAAAGAPSTGRPTTRRWWWASASPSTRATSGCFDAASGEKKLPHARRARRHGRLLRRAVRPGRQVPLRDHGQGLGVAAARPSRSRHRRAHVPDLAREMGRAELRPLARRQDDRLRDQRGRGERAAPAGHRHGTGRSPDRSCPSACSPAWSGTRTARCWASRSSSARSPADAYSYTLRPPAKLERWTESETGGLNAATFSEPELVRWKSLRRRTASRASSTSRPRVVRGQAARHHRRPRRAGGPVPPRLPRPDATTGSTSSGVARALPQRARVLRLRQDVPEARQRRSCARIRSRTSARCSTGSRRGPTSTPDRGSWSPEEATAAT